MISELFSATSCILIPEMSVGVLRWLFAGLLAAVLIFGNVLDLPPVFIGISVGWTNGDYKFAGGTTPWAIALALLVIGLYFILMYGPPASTGQPLPGIFRRFVAFWCDFVIAIICIGPVLGILPVLSEWKRTGGFAWTIVRTTPVRGDSLEAAIGFVCAFGLLILYFALPLLKLKPSPGSCVLGYQILPEKGVSIDFRTAVLRTLLGFIAASGAFLAPFLDRDRKRGQFWLDKVFRTRAVRLG